MKKVVGIFITMVMVFVVASMALGDECNCNLCKAERWIKAYARENGYEKCYNDVRENGVHYYCGVLDIEEFELYEGIEYSIYNWGNWAVEEFNFLTCEIETIEENGFRDVYLVRAKTADNKMKGDVDGITEVEVLFTVIKSQY